MPDMPRLLVPVLSAANFVVGLGAFLVIAAVEPISDDLGVTSAAAGNLLTTYSLAFAVLSPVAVSLTGRVGRRRVLSFGMVVFGLATLASALAPTLFTLHLARAVAALGAGLVTPVSVAVASGLAPPERRASVIAGVFAGLTLAQALGVPVGSWLAYTFGWRVAFGVAAVLALPAVALLWTQVPQGLRFAPVSLRDLGRTLIDAPRMTAALFTGTFLGSMFVLYTYFGPLLSQTMGFGRTGIALMLLAFGVGAVGGNLIGGQVADRVGPVRTLTAIGIAQAVLLPFYALLPFPAVAVFVLTLVWSTTGWCFGAPQQSRLVALDPARAPVLLSLNAASVYLGAAVGAFVGGLALETLGPRALGPVAAVGMVLALCHLALSLRLAKRAPALREA